MTNRYKKLMFVMWLGLILVGTVDTVQAHEPDAECPPNSNDIWVQVNDYGFGDDTPVEIPFERGDVTINNNTYPNYLLGVLLTEIGPAEDFLEVDDETMKAMAILARTVAYANCGCEIIANNADCSKSIFTDNLGFRRAGMDDSVKQQYNPRRRTEFSQAERNRYQRAIDDTAGIYLEYNEHEFDAQYRDVSEEWSLDYGGAPHIRMYDLAGIHHDGEGNGPGFPQINANHYALGENHGDVLPPYTYDQLLAKYLNGFEFVGLDHLPDDQTDYRFNILRFSDYDTVNNSPMRLYSGQRLDKAFSFIVQNSSDDSWRLDCSGNDYDVALAFHWYSYPDKHFIRRNPHFEGTRNRLCGGDFEINHLAPGAPFPPQPANGDPNYAWATLDVNVPPGDYWLRIDVEFLYIEWGSRLDPDADCPNPDPNSACNRALWPTQDIRVKVLPPNLPQPVPVDDVDGGVSHNSGSWSSDNRVELDWQRVDDELDVHYRICWDKKNDGQGDTCEETDDTDFSDRFDDGIYDFRVTALASDGRESEHDWEIEDIRIDTTSPTAILNELPTPLSPASHLLNWSSHDDGSGVDNIILQARHNGGDWITILDTYDEINETVYDFSNGQHGDNYEFQLQVCDKVGYCSDWSHASTTIEGSPKLQVNQPQIVWLTTPTDTVQSVQRTITIQNGGGGSFNWTAGKDSGDYLTLHAPTSGQISNCQTDLTVELAHPGSYGDYTGQITINSDAGDSQIVPILIKVVPEIFYNYLPIIYGGQPQNDLPPCQTVTNESLQTELLMDCTLSSDNWCRTPITFTFVVTSERPVTSWYRFTEISTQTTRSRQSTEWLQYSEPFTYNIEGNQTIHYYSEDDVGNVEPVQTATFKIDLTTPIVEIDAERLSRCDTELGYTIRDLVSGLRNVEVVVDGEPVDEDFNLMYLELGDHTIAITGTDYADWVTTFVRHIPMPADVAGIICTKHILYDLGEIYGPGAHGIVQSLDAKLEAAQRAIERGQIHTAINQLNAFINEVNAQQENHIKLAGAERMIADAEAIIAILEAQ